MVGSSPISLHQQLRLPSVDTVNPTGDLHMKTLHLLLEEGCGALPGHYCWITCPSCSLGSA